MRILTALLALAVAGCRAGEDPAPAGPSPATPAPAPSTQAPPAPPRSATDSVTVVFFGDSLTEGYGLAGGEGQAYPALVAALARAEGVPLRVVNAGVSGNTSAEGRARIEWTLAREQPDVFVLALGGNDGLRGIPPSALEANLRAILEAVRARAPEAAILIAGMEAPPNYGSDYTSRFRGVFPALADEFDAALLPFLLEGVAGRAALNQMDRIHPTAAGHEIMARQVWGALEALLPRAGAAG